VLDADVLQGSEVTLLGVNVGFVDLFEYIQAFHDLAKDCVLAIERLNRS